VHKLEGRSPCVRPRHQWEDNIKMDLGGGGRMGGCELDSSGTG
jgi:hypothetical protein